jgi:hypothetical protein
MGMQGNLAEDIGIQDWTIGTANSTPLASTAVAGKIGGRFAVVFRLGDMAAETIDCIVETCDSNGANNTTLKSATQLAAHASNNDNKMIVIGVEDNELAASGRTHFRGKITTGAGTGGTCAILTLAGALAYGPASGSDSANVVQVVN